MVRRRSTSRRAAAAAFAPEDASVVGIDVAGAVSPVLEVAPATVQDRGETGRQVVDAGGRWASRRLDQCDVGALREAAAWTVERFGRIGILFANARIQVFAPLLEMEDAHWHDQIDVNLTGTCNAIRAVAPCLVANGGGRIIVTSSTQGRHGTKYGAAYSASKGRLIELVKSAALELGQYRITVNAVIPGLIDAPLTRYRQRYAQALDDLDNAAPLEELESVAKRRLAARSPLGLPWLPPGSIAPLVVFLASDDARLASGAACDVTGGDSANNAA
ncbi:short-chain dehydrogenase [Stenotrophomonas acidaminiphila]|nr:short-chain dehydrogenase [Stenotrophomonas acidaminiphila]